MSKQSDEEVMNAIIGLGERSIRKSYYPQLKNKLEEIKQLNKNLEQKVDDRTQELKEQKEVFETLFNETSDAIALIKDDHFIDCNHAVLKLLNYKSKDEFLNIKPHEISPKFQPDGELSSNQAQYHINHCLKEGTDQFEWVHLKSNNEPLWVDVCLTKIVLNNEAIVHVVWRDITYKKALEEQIKERNEQLQESNDELHATIENLKMTQKKLIESEKIAGLGEIIAGIAKEINTPIDIAVTSGTFLAHTIESTQEDNAKKGLSKEELDIFFNSSKSMCKTVNKNLKSIAKLIRYFQQIEILKDEKQKRSFELKEYLHGVLLSLENKLEKKHITLDLHCKENIYLFTTPEDISKIISTLISNSIKHAYPKNDEGTIIIDVIIESDVLYINYKDNGIGIKQENMDKIFDPFFTTSDDENDHGLGLSIIYNIITNKLNGSIKCENRAPHGVNFFIALPLSQNIKSKNIEYLL